MNTALSFDDVLIQPKFSFVQSRKDVNLSYDFLNTHLTIPVISSNMDTITESDMAIVMYKAGGVGALHRFMSIEDNVKMFRDSCIDYYQPIVSIGVGESEKLRAQALINEGATRVMIDVAHGASFQVVDMVKYLAREYPNIKLIVGNFANGESLKEFFNILYPHEDFVKAIKVGVGGGSLCTTRIVTGCGLPTLASIIDCRKVTNLPIIADGGIKNSGDIAKALAAGADVVMLGNMLAGTHECPGKIIDRNGIEVKHQSGNVSTKWYKKYRGSASLESYEVQGKVSEWRSPEGESTLVPYKGSVIDVLKQIEGGLRSALSYTNSFNLQEFKEHAKLVQVSNNSVLESKAHGKL